MWGKVILFFRSILECDCVKNCRPQRDSNSDCQSRRRACWPLDHHHGPRLKNYLSPLLSFSLIKWLWYIAQDFNFSNYPRKYIGKRPDIRALTPDLWANYYIFKFRVRKFFSRVRISNITSTLFQLYLTADVKGRKINKNIFKNLFRISKVYLLNIDYDRFNLIVIINKTIISNWGQHSTVF